MNTFGKRRPFKYLKWKYSLVLFLGTIEDSHRVWGEEVCVQELEPNVKLNSVEHLDEDKIWLGSQMEYIFSKAVSVEAKQICHTYKNELFVLCVCVCVCACVHAHAHHNMKSTSVCPFI